MSNTMSNVVPGIHGLEFEESPFPKMVFLREKGFTLLEMVKKNEEALAIHGERELELVQLMKWGAQNDTLAPQSYVDAWTHVTSFWEFGFAADLWNSQRCHPLYR